MASLEVYTLKCFVSWIHQEACGDKDDLYWLPVHTQCVRAISDKLSSMDAFKEDAKFRQQLLELISGTSIGRDVSSAVIMSKCSTSPVFCAGSYLACTAASKLYSRAIQAGLVLRSLQASDRHSNNEEVPDIIAEPFKLIGSRINVKWSNGKYYSGIISAYIGDCCLFEVLYDDGDVKHYSFTAQEGIVWEILPNLDEEQPEDDVVK